MIGALFAGGGLGLGIYLLIRALRPPRAPLAVALARFDARALPSGQPETAQAQSGGRAQSTLKALVEGIGIDRAPFSADLRVTGASWDKLLADKALLALVGLALPPATGALMVAGGVSVPLYLPAVVSLLLAVTGFFVPDLLLRSQAAARRRTFRHALGSFLDLVALNLAGGAGPEGALARAVTVGDGWPFDLLRDALDVGRSSRDSPWTALGRLGQDLGVVELTELAASLSLAGTEGAKIRESLAAKAESLRRHEVTEAETEASEASEQMSLPVVLLFLGFLVFVCYPAVSRVLTGL